MKIRATRKLVTEQLPADVRPWIAGVFSLINQFITEVVSALNGALVFEENLQGMERELDFTYQSTTVSFPQQFKWTFGSAPVALVVCRALKNDDPVMVLLQWEYLETGVVSITHVVEITTAPAVASLTVGARYKIRVRVSP